MGNVTETLQTSKHAELSTESSTKVNPKTSRRLIRQRDSKAHRLAAVPLAALAVVLFAAVWSLAPGHRNFAGLAGS